MPLVVATGAHPFTGVDLSHLDDLLEGRQTITFQFNPGDGRISEQEVRLGQPDIWKMAPDLSSILWIDNLFPFEAAIRDNPDSGRPLDIWSAAA